MLRFKHESTYVCGVKGDAVETPQEFQKVQKVAPHEQPIANSQANLEATQPLSRFPVSRHAHAMRKHPGRKICDEEASLSPDPRTFRSVIEEMHWLWKPHAP